jgi:hypothetical protein
MNQNCIGFDHWIIISRNAWRSVREDAPLPLANTDSAKSDYLYHTARCMAIPLDDALDGHSFWIEWSSAMKSH